jgi:hypothetical protein
VLLVQLEQVLTVVMAVVHLHSELLQLVAVVVALQIPELLVEMADQVVVELVQIKPQRELALLVKEIMAVLVAALAVAMLPLLVVVVVLVLLVKTGKAAQFQVRVVLVLHHLLQAHL